MGANLAPRKVRIRKVYRMRINKRKLLTRVRIVAILLLLMAANILVQAMLTQTQHQLALVRGEIKELEKTIGRLQYDLAYLGSSERIEVVAVNDLGMKPAENDGRQLLAYTPAFPETPEITLFMQAPGYAGTERGVLQRVADWLSGVGRAMAVPGY
jgi:cell division protein FtsL